ncbi:MAG: PLP-dependent aspartate aminotransferase family protein [Pseudomonadota bacterium]
MTDSATPRRRPATLAAQALGVTDQATGAIIPPIHITTTYERAADNTYPHGLSYARPDNPTAQHVEAVITALEGGSHSMVFASGMAAAVAAFEALPRPAHIIAPKVMYWGLRLWLTQDAPAQGLEVSFVDMTDLDAVAHAIQAGRTRMIWAETPGNPMWDVLDVRALSNMAHGAGALLGVDSTAATPILTQPLTLGADVVMHSATKYLNGHSDVLAGSLTFAREDSYAQRASAVRNHTGAIIGAFEAALLLRGLRTLHVRVAAQCRNAMAIAKHMGRLTPVTHVLYPGLETHPGHAIAARQMDGGFGGMLSLRFAGGAAAAMRVAAGVKVWKRATSLGGIESLIEHRASIEGPSTPVPDDLLRLSVGIEDADDLIADLERAIMES